MVNKCVKFVPARWASTGRHFLRFATQKPPFTQALIGKAMEPVIQEEPTGCGIAASAALAGVSYAEAKQKANALGIYAADTALWSETEHVRALLREFGISASSEETPFKSWESLPDKALMGKRPVIPS